jgi:hypothetical protein
MEKIGHYEYVLKASDQNLAFQLQNNFLVDVLKEFFFIRGSLKNFHNHFSCATELADTESSPDAFAASAEAVTSGSSDGMEFSDKDTSSKSFDLLKSPAKT